MPRVTVVVATRNRRERLRQSVPQHEAPVIVVDNGSTDGGPEAIDGTTVIRLERNLGGAARNVGTEAADTPYVAFCDDDSWFAPGALARAADLLDAHPRLALVQARILVGPEQRLDPTCAAMARSPLTPAEGQPGHALLSFIACAVVVRRSAFLATGGFSEHFAIGGEEELVGWDLAAAGWQLSYVPAVHAHHHPGRHGPRRRELLTRNALWTAWLRRPLHVAARQSAAIAARAARDPAVARGVRSALAGAPRVLRERRVSPPHVEAMHRTLERSARPRSP
jgi:GT2 family glycosyltransferase